MKKTSVLLTMLLVAGICLNLCACGAMPNDQNEGKTENTQENNTLTETHTKESEETDSKESEETTPESTIKDPIDIETIGGVVIVGKIDFDESGWHIVPERPLNITYSYFLNNPSVFQEQTRISMIDSKDDGIDKTVYLGHTVTVHGEFRFVRNDFETLYLSPYWIDYYTMLM